MVCQQNILGNYPARNAGIKKLQLISEARKICPGLILRSGEDLTPFRKMSDKIFNATKSFFSEYINKVTNEMCNYNYGEIIDYTDDILAIPNIVKSGLDELFIDVSELASFLVDNFYDENDSFELRTNNFNTSCHILQGIPGNHISITTYQNKMICISNNIAYELRKYINNKLNIESCAGIAPNKISSKLAVNM